MKKGFTLAEIMIVLSVIGILTAILLPVAFHATPDENVMKFKKGHNALLSAIRELVNSDKYYLDGDLGVRYDGVQIIGTVENSASYFCKTLAEVIQTSNVNCPDDYTEAGTGISGAINLYEPDKLVDTSACDALKNNSRNYEITPERLQTAKEKMDELCKKVTPKSYITTNDKISFYEVNSQFKFGSQGAKSIGGCGDTPGSLPRFLSPPGQFPANYSDQDGFDIAYKVECMDIDEFNDGEDPFGYGIRADGKVLAGARADEWLQKSIQEKED